MFKKILILGLSACAMFSSLIPSFNDSDFVMVKADSSDIGYTSTKLNWCYVSSYGYISSWHDYNNQTQHIDNVLTGDFVNYTPVCQNSVEGKEIFGTLYDNFNVETKERVDLMSYYSANLNYYSTDSANVTFVISYESALMDNLVSIASQTNSTFKIPSLSFDNDVFSLFDVSPSGVDVLSVNKLVKQVQVGYHSENSYTMTSSGAPGERHTYTFVDIAFSLNKGLLNKISEIQYLTYGELATIRIPNSRSCFVLPYEVTYFDYEVGSICLGHSIYGDEYGTDNPTKLLSKVTFEVDSYGKKQYSWVSMSKSEYQQYMVNGNYTEEQKRSALLNKMVYGPRGTYENETAPRGTGGLVWQPYCPYKQYDITKSSVIKIKSLSFVYKSSNSTFASDGYDEETFIIPNDEMEFSYFADKAIGRCSVELHEENIDTGGYKQQTNWWTYLWTGVLTLGVACAVEGITDAIMTDYANRGLNIQRFYFNIKDSYNQKIPNVTKIQFKYQQGKKEIKKDYNNDGTLDVGQYSDLPIQTLTTDLVDSTTNSSTNWFNTISSEENGFVSIEDSPQYLTGEDGISLEYSYYYQNVYQTKDNQPINGKNAYYNHICYFSMMSIWYETTVGQTIRLTTDRDGYYLITDHNGNQVVMNINDSENPSDMSVEEFLRGDNADETWHNYDDGTQTSTDDRIDDWEKFWEDLGNNLTGIWDKSRTIILIALGVLAFGVCFVLVLKFASGLSSIETNKQLRKMTKKEKKRKRGK